MDAQALERIAKHDLGIGDVPVIITAAAQPDRWHVEIGGRVPATLTIFAGAGTSAQFVRDQILEQYSAR
jgi:hypothetical protein